MAESRGRRSRRKPEAAARKSGPAGLRDSRSMRTICWVSPMTRVLREVRRCGSAKSPASSTPSRLSSWRNRLPGWSSPTNPRTSTWAPRATRLLTTLPAPPSVRVSRSTSTTATGASGEMRATRPQRYSSSMKSPATKTRRAEKPERSRRRSSSPHPSSSLLLPDLLRNTAASAPCCVIEGPGRA